MGILSALKKLLAPGSRTAEPPTAAAPKPRCRFINHRGVEILITDLSGVSGLGYVKAIREAVAFVQGCGRKDLLMLYDVTGTKVYDGALPALKHGALDTKYLVKKRAVIGITEVQMAFLRAVSTFIDQEIRAFPSEQEALDWLAES